MPLRKRWQFFLYREKSGGRLSNFVYLSQEKLIELEKELKELKTEGRKKMAQRIAEARSYGDLSENAEYDAAKEAQGHLELKISKMEELLAKAKIVDTSKFPEDEIHILSTAQVKNLKNGKTYRYTLVSEEEANLQEGKIAISSPVGGALMGAKKGEIVEAKVPAGIIQFEIVNIE
jgi:transcription elongation factor GreA